MRVAAQPAVSCVGLLDETPIVVAYGGRGPAVVFDADALTRALGPAWPAVDRALAEVTPHEAHAALSALAAEAELIAEVVAPLAAAEARLLEGDDAAARAVIVLAWVQARIAAIVERGR
jgi:hypothetical protein